MSMLLVVVAACSADIDKEKSAAIESAKQSFEKKPKKPNEKSKGTELYVASGYKIKQEEEHNIILEKKNNPVLIFINPNETYDSQSNSDAIEKKKDDYIGYEKFEKKNRSGFIAVKELEDKKYELTIGVGGVKLTTHSSTKDLSTYAKEMMEIAASIKQEEVKAETTK